jgi:hypothetical protein
MRWVSAATSWRLTAPLDETLAVLRDARAIDAQVLRDL